MLPPGIPDIGGNASARDIAINPSASSASPQTSSNTFGGQTIGNYNPPNNTMPFVYGGVALIALFIYFKFGRK